MKYIASVIVKSSDIGLNGNLFGAILLQWIDSYGALYTYKYLHHRFVTYKIKDIHFLKPSKQGDCIDFYVDNLIFNKMSCSFDLIAKNNNIQKKPEIIKSNMTFVAINEDTGKSIKLNPYLFELDEFKKYVFEKTKQYISNDENTFHNLSYVENIIYELDKLNLKTDIYKKLFLAICYQDSFYEPGNSLNEENSADIFLNDWKFLNNDIKEDIKNLILSTKIKNDFYRLKDINNSDILHDLNNSSFIDIDTVRNNDIKIKYERSKIESQELFLKNKINMLEDLISEGIFYSTYFKRFNKFSVENAKEYQLELKSLYKDIIDNKVN